MHRGYIKAFRRITEWEWYTDIKTCHLFRHILLRANFKDKNHQGTPIKRGQYKTGTIVLSAETGLGRQSVRTSLDKLVLTNEITIQSTNRFSVITVINYDLYQSGADIDDQLTSQSTTPLTTNQPATNQQLTTTKNVNTVENEKKILNIPFSKFKEDYPVMNGGKFGAIPQAETRWKNLTNAKRDAAMASIPHYIAELEATEWRSSKGAASWLLKELWSDHEDQEAEPTTKQYTHQDMDALIAKRKEKRDAENRV